MTGNLAWWLPVGLALALAGCTAEPDDAGGDDVGEGFGDGLGDTGAPGDEEPGDDGATGDGSGGSARDPANGTVAVVMDEFFFDAKEVWVEAGTTVRWVNEGEASHTATAEDGAWDSGDVPPGEAVRMTFTVTGAHPYVCEYHEAQDMVGTVHVVAAA